MYRRRYLFLFILYLLNTFCFGEFIKIQSHYHLQKTYTALTGQIPLIATRTYAINGEIQLNTGKNIFMNSAWLGLKMHKGNIHFYLASGLGTQIRQKQTGVHTGLFGYMSWHKTGIKLLWVTPLKSTSLTTTQHTKETEVKYTLYNQSLLTWVTREKITQANIESKDTSQYYAQIFQRGILPWVHWSMDIYAQIGFQNNQWYMSGGANENINLTRHIQLYVNIHETMMHIQSTIGGGIGFSWVWGDVLPHVPLIYPSTTQYFHPQQTTYTPWEPNPENQLWVAHNAEEFHQGLQKNMPKILISGLIKTSELNLKNIILCGNWCENIAKPSFITLQKGKLSNTANYTFITTKGNVQFISLEIENPYKATTLEINNASIVTLANVSLKGIIQGTHDSILTLDKSTVDNIKFIFSDDHNTSLSYNNLTVRNSTVKTISVNDSNSQESFEIDHHIDIQQSKIQDLQIHIPHHTIWLSVEKSTLYGLTLWGKNVHTSLHEVTVQIPEHNTKSDDFFITVYSGIHQWDTVQFVGTQPKWIHIQDHTTFHLTKGTFDDTGKNGILIQNEGTLLGTLEFTGTVQTTGFINTDEFQGNIFITLTQGTNVKNSGQMQLTDSILRNQSGGIALFNTPTGTLSGNIFTLVSGGIGIENQGMITGLILGNKPDSILQSQDTFLKNSGHIITDNKNHIGITSQTPIISKAGFVFYSTGGQLQSNQGYTLDFNDISGDTGALYLDNTLIIGSGIKINVATANGVTLHIVRGLLHDFAIGTLSSKTVALKINTYTILTNGTIEHIKSQGDKAIWIEGTVKNVTFHTIINTYGDGVWIANHGKIYSLKITQGIINITQNAFVFYSGSYVALKGITINGAMHADKWGFYYIGGHFARKHNGDTAIMVKGNSTFGLGANHNMPANTLTLQSP